MAGSATVGALRVVLGLDSAQFETGMKNSQSALQRFGSIAKAGAMAVGAAMVVAGGAIAMAMKGVIDEADKMSKLSQSIGVPITELSKLRYAADLAGVDIDALAKGMKRLAAGMLDSTQSATGPAAKSFAMLGVSVTDAEGKLRPVSSVVSDLAARFAKLQDGPEKTALAMRIFGKSGADMIPLLNAGSDGLREMYDEALALGIVLDEETGRAAEDFNDNLTRLGVVKDGIVTKITAGMLPALSSLTDSMVGAAKNSEAMRVIGVALGWTLNSLVTVAVLVGAAFIGVASDIGAAWDAANRFVRMDFKGGVEAFRAGTSRTQTLLKSAESFVGTLWRPPSGAPPAITRVNDEIDTLDRSANRASRSVKRMTDAEREAQRAAEELARETKRAAEELARDAARVFEDTRTPAEQYAAEIARLTRFLDAAAISQDTFNRAVRQAGETFEANDPGKQRERALQQKKNDFNRDTAEAQMRLAREQREDLEDATYDGIRSGLEAAADGDLGKYLAARLRASLMDGLADSLTSLVLGEGKGDKHGGGIGGILGRIGSWFKPSGDKAGDKTGGGLGSLFGNMASWLKLPGFKTGGSFKVGGSGGVDSSLIAFRATPGEMVDITRPGQKARDDQDTRGLGAAIIQNFNVRDYDSFRRSQRQIARDTRRGLDRS